MTFNVTHSEKKKGNVVPYLDRLAIDEQAVQVAKRLAGAVRMVEGDVSDAAANTARPVRDLDLLDRADRLLEILLSNGSRG